MGDIFQVYDPPGAPYRPLSRADEVVSAWNSHRARFRAHLDTMSPDAWSAPTRCDAWDATSLVGHLADATAFVTQTLEASRRGEVTRLLDGFDPATSPKATVAGRSEDRSTALARFLAMDDRAAELVASAAVGDWKAPAEAPPGRVPASSSLAHMLFDSCIHERDLMVPAGSSPASTDEEAIVVVDYIASLVSLGLVYTKASDLDLVLRLSDPEVVISVGVDDDGWGAVTEGEPRRDGRRSLTVEGSAVDVSDLATGRPTQGVVTGDDEGLAILGLLAAVLA